MKIKSLRILLTGGGSGGSTAPLLGLAQTLAERNEVCCRFRFLGTKKGPERRIVEEAGIEFHWIPSGKLRRYCNWRNLIDPLYVVAGFFAGIMHLMTFRAHVAVSAGSFVSVPVALACRIFGIPHLILQMDIQPGLANRLMSPFSTAVACHFEESLKSFKSIAIKRIIGPVVRKNIQTAEPSKANKQFGLDPKLPLITLTGGGQGARLLNKALSKLLEIWLKRWQVVHLTGKGNLDDKIQHPHYHPIEFLEKGLGNLFSRSELVITRAGMGTLGELSVLSRDALVIPLPGTHQEENAKALAAKNSIFRMNQNIFCQYDSKDWNEFIKQRKPGQKGNILHQIWGGAGNDEFADMVLLCSEKRYRK